MKTYIKAVLTVVIACMGVSIVMPNLALAQNSTDSRNNAQNNDGLSREAMISQLLNDVNQGNVSQKSKTEKDVKKVVGSSGTFTSLRDMNNSMFMGKVNPQPQDADNDNDNNNDVSALSPQIYDSMKNQAFSNMTRTMMPLSPDQIKQLHVMYNKSRSAAASVAGIPPKPTSSSVVIDLSPGATPPVIRLLEGYITSLVFLDSTGEAWPITAVDVGDPRSFNVQWDHKGNTLLIQALSAYKAANLAVIVKGLTTPVMLTLLPGQTAVDYRVDVRIPRLGPNANASMIDQLPSASNVQLLSALDGIPPAGSKAVEIEGGDAQAWLIKDELYLRTSMTLLSPSWVSTISSADGTHAYLLQISPILLALNHGKIVQLKLKGL